MKKIVCLFLSIFILFGIISPVCLAQGGATSPGDSTPTGENTEGWQNDVKNISHTWEDSRSFIEHNPVQLVDTIYGEANKKSSEEVQNTDLDVVSSNACSEVPAGGTYTISKTLCNLKQLSKDYIQYIMYIWLTVASILIIRNWFKIVTSSDREKQISTFKKNLTYIVIWVVLLIWFYYIIDLFVSMVNLVLEK